MNFLNVQHFPIFAIMLYFLGAFLIVVFGKGKAMPRGDLPGHLRATVPPDPSLPRSPA